MSSYICPICRDSLIYPKDIPPEEKRRYRPVATYCGHIFHQYCLESWLYARDSRLQPLTCPSCFFAVRDADIVKIHPSTNDRFKDYSLLLIDVDEQDRRIKILTQEEDVLKNQPFFRDMLERIKKSEEQTKTISQLQKVIDCKKEKLGADYQHRKSLALEKENLQKKIEEYKIRIEERNKVNNDSKVVLKTIRRVFDGYGLILTRDENERGNNSEDIAPKHINSEEILDKVDQILAARQFNLKKTTKKTCEEDFFPLVVFQTAIVGSPISYEEKLRVQEYVATIGSPEKILSYGVVVYRHHGQAYFPTLELFQLQLVTYLRVTSVTYRFQHIDIKDDKVPIIRIGDHDIYDAEICSHLIQEIFISQQASLNKMSRKPFNKFSKLWNIFGGNIFWGILLWQWSLNNGTSMKLILPKKFNSAENQSRIAMQIKAKVEKTFQEQSFGYLGAQDFVNTAVSAIKIISEDLGNKESFSGSYPQEIDCCGFILLAQILWNTPESQLQKELIQYQNLVNFVLKMKNVFWPEWAIGGAFPQSWI